MPSKPIFKSIVFAWPRGEYSDTKSLNQYEEAVRTNVSLFLYEDEVPFRMLSAYFLLIQTDVCDLFSPCL